MTPRGRAALLAFAAVSSNLACRPRPSRTCGLAALALAVTARPIEGRLAAPTAHRPFDPQRPVVLAALPTEVLASAQQDLGARTAGDPAATSARAGIELWTGQPEVARATVLEGLRAAPDDARLWTDLAAVDLQVARRELPVLRTAARALDEALRAVELAPGSPEASFNEALALEKLGLDGAARRAWTRTMAIETDAGWKGECERHVKALDEAARDEWPRRRASLLAGGPVDDGWLRETAERWPQETREAIEDVVLPAWGRAVIANEQVGAGRALARARAAAAALGRRTSDSLLSEAVAAVEAAHGPAARDLAMAHASYGAGAEAYDRTRREQSLAAFQQALRLFAARASPFALRARLRVCMALTQFTRYAEALDCLTHVEGAAAPYPTVLGRALWLRGMPLTHRGEMEAALRSFRRSRAVLEGTGEGENLAALSGTAADTLRRMGEHSEGWRFLSGALSNLREVRTPWRRLTLALNGSLYTDDDGLGRAALAFEDASLREARDWGAASTTAEALTRRARLYLKAGRSEPAARDLEEARLLLADVPSASLREYVEGWAAWTEGERLVATRPLDALHSMQKAWRLLRTREPDEIPRLSIGLGLAASKSGDREAAARHLLAGLKLFEARLDSLSGDRYRVSYLDDSWRIFDALIELHAVQLNDTETAFTIAERGRQRAMRRGAAAPLGLGAIRSALPRGSSILYYVTLDADLLIWLIEPDGVHASRRHVSREALRRQVASYRALIEARTPEPAIRAASQALGALLVPAELSRSSPLGPLAIVADGFLNSVPFASLVDPATGRLLVEERPLSFALSATHAVEGSGRRQESQPPRALFVGGSATGPAAAGLGVLPQAGAELRHLATLYRDVTLLENEAATMEALRAAVRGRDVLHFAGHAVANDSFPWQSKLLMAPSPSAPDGAASLESLRGVDFSNLRLVVLSACRTASGPIARGEGAISLVRPFVTQRVPAVVGSIWDVDDEASRDLLTRFHQAYLSNGDAALSLQQAQEAFIASGRPLRTWGAFVVTAPLRGAAASRPTHEFSEAGRPAPVAGRRSAPNRRPGRESAGRSRAGREP